VKAKAPTSASPSPTPIFVPSRASVALACRISAFASAISCRTNSFVSLETRLKSSPSEGSGSVVGRGAVPSACGSTRISRSSRAMVVILAPTRLVAKHSRLVLGWLNTPGGASHMPLAVC
jgi:hypothetical protein